MGIGVTGALLGSSEAREALRDNGVAIGFIALITNLLITGLLVNLKELDRIKDNPTKRLRILMLVASVSLAVNTFVVALVDGLSWKWIFGSVLGVWILPLLLLLKVESTGFGKRPSAPEPTTQTPATPTLGHYPKPSALGRNFRPPTDLIHGADTRNTSHAQRPSCASRLSLTLAR